MCHWLWRTMSKLVATIKIQEITTKIQEITMRHILQ